MKADREGARPETLLVILMEKLARGEMTPQEAVAQFVGGKGTAER